MYITYVHFLVLVVVKVFIVILDYRLTVLPHCITIIHKNHWLKVILATLLYPVWFRGIFVCLLNIW